MNKGRLIVFEGTDGSGKATQSRLLFERLEREGVDCRKLNFPRYGEKSAALVELYLSGAFGSHPDDVNAYAASTFYAVIAACISRSCHRDGEVPQRFHISHVLVHTKDEVEFFLTFKDGTSHASSEGCL